MKNKNNVYKKIAIILACGINFAFCSNSKQQQGEESEVSGAGGNCGFRLFLLTRENFIDGAMKHISDRVVVIHENQTQHVTIRDLLLANMANIGSNIKFAGISPQSHNIQLAVNYSCSKSGINKPTNDQIHAFLIDVYIGRITGDNGHLSCELLPVAACIRGLNVNFHLAGHLTRYVIGEHLLTINVVHDGGMEHFNLWVPTASSEPIMRLAKINKEINEYFLLSSADLSVTDLAIVIPPCFQNEANDILKKLKNASSYQPSQAVRQPKFDQERINTLRDLLEQQMDEQTLISIGYTQEEMNNAKTSPYQPRQAVRQPQFDPERINTLRDLLKLQMDNQTLINIGYTQEEINNAEALRTRLNGYKV